MSIKIGTFSGFQPQALGFLFELGLNNNKTWFEEHRSVYQDTVLLPVQRLVENLGDSMRRIDPEFEIAPMVDKTISRIYRDVRFSKDKSPYRSNVWITFKRRKEEWQDAPAYYFELSPEGYRHGMGFYSASSQTMQKFREQLIVKKDQFLKISKGIADFGRFKLEGENYKRPAANCPDERLSDWYQKKSFHITSFTKPNDLFFSVGLSDYLKEGFQSLSDIYHFLLKITSESLQN